MRVGALAACVAVALGVARPAPAQHPSLGAPEARPLTQRLALADAVAIARVAAVEAGRIRLEAARPVIGTIADRFAVKRSPAAPPGLAPGERVALLLRGARSPYLLVCRADELLRLSGEESATDWAHALADLHRARGDPTATVRVLAAWLRRDGSALQREAARALADPTLPVSALPEDAYPRLAELALSADTAALRRPAAGAAVRGESGRRRLLEGLPGNDPLVLIAALPVSLESDPEPAKAALLRSLRDERREVREAALRVAAPAARSRDVRAALVEIAGEDPDAALRDLARRLLRASAASADAPG